VGGSLSVAGDLNVTGNINFAPGASQNFMRVETVTLAVALNENGAPGTAPMQWSHSFAAFTQVYAAFVVLQGFSLWGNDGNTAFTNYSHNRDTNSITQHVFVRIKTQSLSQVTGECFCSEAYEPNQGDNTVLFTLVVMGRP